jgi:hypothetical protein
VRPPLLGVVLGTLLHQRGVFTLHGSAVSIDGEAVAFLGQKQSGKSTLAAALFAKGHPLVTDDVLAVDPGAAASIPVYPAYPSLKLSEDVASALGMEHGRLDPERALNSSMEKAYYPARDGFVDAPLPLRKIYLLDWGDRPATTQITGRDAFTALVREAYAPRFLGSAVSTPTFFEQCKQVVQHIPILRLTRPFDLSSLDRTVALIERDSNRYEQPVG